MALGRRIAGNREEQGPGNWPGTGTVRTPWSRRWQRFRLTGLPIVVFVGVAMLIMQGWAGYRGPVARRPATSPRLAGRHDSAVKHAAVQSVNQGPDAGTVTGSEDASDELTRETRVAHQRTLAGEGGSFVAVGVE